jgi:hypothetical protein
MIRADEEHYWTTWTNTCPYTIDSVYVMVGFADRASKEVADGVWSLHFIAPGAHRTMRFSAPGKLSDFASVHQRKITADMNEAFGKAPLTAVELAAVNAYREAVAKGGGVPRHATVINDSGEGAYRALPAAAQVPATIVMLKNVSTASIGDPGEGSFRTDFPDAWRSVLSPQETLVSPAPHGAFVRFVSDEKPLFP